jgi:hypothetical protein
MVRYAAQAVPWGRVALAAVLVVLLMELVRWDPWVLWPLQGATIGLLAGAAGWCFDEPAAAVVDVTPRSLAWRTAARLPAAVGLALVWCAVVWQAGDHALFGRRDAVLVEGLAALAVGAAYAGWRRARGEGMPGVVLATAVVPLTSAWALVRPLEATLPVFPYGTSSPSDWTSSTMGWTVLGTLALVVLAAALTDAPWWGVRVRAAVRPHTSRSGHASTL